MLDFWQNFYSWQDPIALDLGFLQLRWYSIMYVTALLTGYLIGRKMVQRGEFGISLAEYDLAFFWVEIGVVVGARVGYVAFYDAHAAWYFLHPWEFFNPFENGRFVGISGLSYHGAIIGFIVAAWIFSKRHKLSALRLLDLSAVAGSGGYFFGRIGNFFNNLLIGRETSMPWGVYSHGALRHPSALYEALLEGVLVFLILFFYRKKRKFDGELMALYGILYSLARFVAEFFRRPDPHIGFVLFDFFTMGQILSAIMALACLGVLLFLRARSARTAPAHAPAPKPKKQRKGN
ncbi:MAG: prolipoprotein diacylglyceryl transferase [Helicobacteraceae bacterium]